MIEILGELLCIYLVFKGIEIFMVALTSPKENTSITLIAIVALTASIIVAVWYGKQIHDHADGARKSTDEIVSEIETSTTEARAHLEKSIREFERQTGVKVP